MFSRFFGKKPARKPIKRPYFKPNLEHLEDRLVPDAMRWSPPNPLTDIQWSTAGNWFDSTTGAVATAAPSVNDDVQFRGTGQWNNNCLVSSPAICKSINANSPDHYTQTLYIYGTSLTVQDSTSGYGFSDWEYGTIRAIDKPGTLNILENFTYNSASLNPVVSPTLTVNIGASAFTPIMYLSSNCTFADATFNVGYDNGGNTKYGSLQFQNIVNPTDLDGNPINVSSGGVLYFSGPVNITSCGNINSTGAINLGTGCLISMISGDGITTTGGIINSSPSGNSNIDGDLDMTNTILHMNRVINSGYGSIDINGDLVFNSGCGYYYYVNGADLYQCNQVIATNITFTTGANVLSFCRTDGFLETGDHDYVPLEAYNSLVGSFSTYKWIFATWNWSYTGTEFHLTKTV